MEKEKKDEKYIEWEEDEIDLYELWEVLVKRKKLILGLFFGIVIVAVLLSFVLPKVYEVKTTVIPKMILSLPDNLKITPDKVKALFSEEAYLKQVFTEEKSLPEIDINVDKKSDMINIVYKTSKPKEGVEKIKKLLPIVDRDGSLLRETEDYLTMKKDNINIAIKELEDKRNFYKGREEDIKLRMENMDKDIELLDKRLNAVINQLGNVNLNIAKVLSYTNMIKSLQSERARLITKYYDLRREREGVKNTIIDIEKKIEAQKIELSKVEKDIKNLGIFDVVVKPYYIDTPVAPKKKLIVGVAGVTALFFGIFLAFFLEFLERGKKRHSHS